MNTKSFTEAIIDMQCDKSKPYWDKLIAKMDPDKREAMGEVGYTLFRAGFYFGLTHKDDELSERCSDELQIDNSSHH